MATYAVQAFVFFPNSQKRNSVQQKIEAEVATRETWDQVIILPYADALGSGLSVEVRVTTEAAMLELYEAAKAEFQTQGWLSGSRIFYHTCTHDEPSPQVCVISGETEATV